MGSVEESVSLVSSFSCGEGDGGCFPLPKAKLVAEARKGGDSKNLPFIKVEDACKKGNLAPAP